MLLLVTLTISTFSQKRKESNSLKEFYSLSTTGVERMASFEQKKTMSNLFKEVPLRNIGPTVMSGRVTDLAWDPNDAAHWYVAYASGGLWETKNYGISFEPIMDHLAVITIGAIAVDWKNNKIWVGTGENNSSRSSYSGVGIYSSSNNGKTWEYNGLPESHHIGKVVLHPTDPEKIWVAVLGHLYSSNKERGVYFSNDGGRNWSQQLYIDENTGAIDLEINSENPLELYASFWQRSRKAWNFEEAGEKSGIYQTLDGGKTWKPLMNGIPNGKGTGRIGISLISNANEKVLYASLDNQNHRDEDKKEDPKKSTLKKTDFLKMSRAEFIALDTAQLNLFLKEYSFPKELTADSLKSLISENKYSPKALYDFVFDANEDLFNTPVIGLEVYRYDDATSSWKKSHDGFLDDVVFSYGYYFGMMEINPAKTNEIYTCGVPLIKSDDGGKSWYGINPGNVHVDHHVLKFHPSNPDLLLNGSDGGVQYSMDGGKTFVNCNTISVGQFYTVQVDNETPYNVYGGLQDNGVWRGPSNNKPNRDWTYDGHYPFKFLMGGDGMQVQVHPKNSNIVYTGYQFGNYARLDLSTEDYKDIHPEHSFGEQPLRYNWQTPILISPHHPDIFYICSNRVHRSLDGGNTFSAISPDLTKGYVQGDVPFGTITSISESPLSIGLLVVGADDGSLHLSEDAGNSWRSIQLGLPSKYISRVIFSSHRKNRIYVALNGYREDDMQPYLFVSDDLGKSWKNIASNLSLEPVNVIREDDTNEEILYVGTDNGLYVSLNRGASYSELGNLPSVAVHDLVIQKREQELVIATHGRSLWIADLRPIRSNQKENLTCIFKNKYNYFDLEDTSPNWYNRPVKSIVFSYKSNKEEALIFKSEDGQVVGQITLPSSENTWRNYEITQSKDFHLPKGKITVGSQSFEVE